MESLLTKVADVIMELPEESLLDKDSLIASCIVKGLDSFSKINKVVLLSRNKALTEAKTEEVGRELSKILFYSSCLVYLRELATDGFDVDSIKDYSTDYDTIYQQDAIMCSLSGIKNIVDIAEVIYADPSAPLDDNPEVSKAMAVMTVKNEAVDAEDRPSDVTEEEYYLVSIFASCYLLSERLLLDFDTLIYNAKLLEKI